jgi:SAM-dependent methyltransferase
VLTVDFGQFPIEPGERVLDLGCGFGRHAFEAYRRGAHVVAVDRSQEEVASVTAMFRAMAAEGEAPRGLVARAVRGDLLSLPFPDASFDVVMASEVLEHIPDDDVAMAEISRVLRPGGRVAVTVPRWWPERVCWALSRDYHDIAGGHVRIYRGDHLEQRLRDAGLRPRGSHHAHALHSPYWWLNCAFGKESVPSRLYHQMLVWDILKRPWVTRAAEHALNPVLGKSLVVYADKPIASAEAASVAA